MSTEQKIDGKKKLRLVTLDKKDNELYVLRERPVRVYLKRALRLINQG